MTSVLSARPSDTSVLECGYLSVLATTECELLSLSMAVDFVRVTHVLSICPIGANRV